MPLKILLADDSMTAQNMGKKILTDAGYEVVAVSNGAAAVKKIAEHRPDVAVLDVYMPGYTGLEVCERLKSALETTHMPVLLTVGRMEPFKMEEGNRVKADGIIIKPFEATDLLAAIQKLQRKLGSPQAVVAGPVEDEANYEKTQKIRIPYLEEFKDASYEEWKVTAPAHPAEGEHREIPKTAAFSVPEAMQGTPAMGMDELEVVPHGEAAVQRITQAIESEPTSALRTGTEQLEPQTQIAAAAAATPAPAADKPTSTSGVWRALDKARDWFGGAAEAEGAAKSDAVAFIPLSELPEEKAAELTPAPPSPPPGPVQAQPAAEVPEHVRALHEIAYEKAQSYGATANLSEASAPAVSDALLEHTASQPVEIAAVAEPDLESTGPVKLDNLEVAADPALEPTVQPAEESHAAHTMDPGLVTDATQLAQHFPTNFGVANPDDIPVGVATDYPQLYADATPSIDPPPSSTTSEITEEQLASVESAEASVVEHAPASAVASDRSVPSSWVAEEAPLEDHESALKLHEEMDKVYKVEAAPLEAEVADVEVIEPPTESAEQLMTAAVAESAPDPQLAAAMAAAVGAEAAPPLPHAVSEAAAQPAADEPGNHTALVADIVQRVVEMMKPELIRRISAELKNKK